MPGAPIYHNPDNPRRHPLRYSIPPAFPFEPMKMAIAASLGLQYVSPDVIWSPGPNQEKVQITIYDDEGNYEEHDYYENVVEGVENMVAGSADMLQKTGSKPVTGLASVNLPGPVVGILPPGFMEYIPS